MAGCQVIRKRNLQSKPKVKTGCATCRSVSTLITSHSTTKSVAHWNLLGIRTRKIKCDEHKPFCRRCVDTGRTCDGYDFPLRPFISHPTNKTVASSEPVPPTLTEITPKDIALLNRYFSTKTIFNVKLDCNEEAKRILRASLTNPPIRHAISSLRALREGLEASGDASALLTLQTPSYDYGLQQYCMALAGLASNLSSSGSDVLKLALLCCHIFISIEQVRENYVAMVQHIIQGFRIMREHRARPNLTASQKLVLSHHDQLPFLDVFIIKLFAAPCKFADTPAINATASANVTSPYQLPAKSWHFRTLAPDMRTELTRIATLTIEFLDKVAHVESEKIALRLLPERASLLDSLEFWLADLDSVQTENSALGPEPLSVSFLRLFYHILKVVLLGTLESSPKLHSQLRTENDRLEGVASTVGERVKAYRTYSGTRSSPLKAQ
ncbi:hypothetical protein S40288_08276 [Stachybotrys chartarum IBT 40288]|nr:hypothetical protein S40288_08276 [Stachybotrys chartarum IBT 40288]